MDKDLYRNMWGVEFLEVIFLSSSGVQFKTIVEYAPSQRVPKQWSKKDGREGTLLKGTYLSFLSKA